MRWPQALHMEMEQTHEFLAEEFYDAQGSRCFHMQKPDGQMLPV